MDSALPPEIVRECRESTWLSSKVLRLAALDFEEPAELALNTGAALGARLRPCSSNLRTVCCTTSRVSVVLDGAWGRASRDARKQVERTNMTRFDTF